MRPVAFLIALGIVGASAAQPAQPVAPQPFRSGTELVLVDVTVLDHRGAPVTGLTAGDFRLSVGGTPRAIQSVQFIGTEPAPARTAARDASMSTNSLPSSGRLLLIVVDESNVRFGASLAVVRAAESLMSRLSPGDLVGLSRIPDGGGVEFTTDRSLIAHGLSRVTGRPARSRAPRVTVFVSEAADFEEGQRLQWPAALRRECGEPNTPGYGLCVGAMKEEARSLLLDESVRAGATVRNLTNLMTAAVQATTPVTMVLISESLFLGRDPGVLAGLSAAGAAGRVSLHIVRPAVSPFDAGTSGYSSDPTWDNELRRRGLAALAAQFGGTLHDVSSIGASAFDRISTEISGYYLLGIEPAARDRNGRAQRLRVEVPRPGVTVRARPTFALPLAGREPTDTEPTERLRRMVSSPVPVRGLAMKIAAHSVSDSDRDRVRVLIAADIGAAIEHRRPFHVGLIVIEDGGEVVTQTAATLHLTPSRAGTPSPASFTTSLVLKPGDYSVRLAAIDAEGRGGSVHHNLSARLTERPGAYRSSDLIVAPPPTAGAFPRFSVSSIIDEAPVTALVEVTHDNDQALVGLIARFEVTREGEAQPVVSSDGHAGVQLDTHRRSFSSALPLDGVPAGEYVLRSILKPKDGASWIVERPFRFDTRGAPASTTPVVLDEDVARLFIDELAQRFPVSAALAAFVDAARMGAYVAAPEAESRTHADLAMVTFVGGLAALREGKLVLARALLSQTQRSAPGFDGPSYYLRLLR